LFFDERVGFRRNQTEIPKLRRAVLHEERSGRAETKHAVKLYAYAGVVGLKDVSSKKIDREVFLAEVTKLAVMLSSGTHSYRWVIYHPGLNGNLLFFFLEESRA